MNGKLLSRKFIIAETIALFAMAALFTGHATFEQAAGLIMMTAGTYFAVNVKETK